MVKSKYFNVGKVVATIGVNNTIKENEQFARGIISALQRYVNKDWETWTKRTSRPMRTLYNILMICIC